MKAPVSLPALMLGLALASPVKAQDVAAYLQGGISGIGLGVSMGWGGPFRVRADLINSYSRDLNGTRAGVPYAGTLKLSDSGIYVDYYPNGGGFRLVGGLMLNQSKIDLQASAATGASAQINGRTYALTGADAVNAQVKYPSVMPYLGIGWGMGDRDKGFTFIADLGVGFGKATGTLNASPSLRGKITSAGLNADDELSASRSQLQDEVAKAGYYPVLRIGVGYKF